MDQETGALSRYGILEVRHMNMLYNQRPLRAAAMYFHEMLVGGLQRDITSALGGWGVLKEIHPESW